MPLLGNSIPSGSSASTATVTETVTSAVLSPTTPSAERGTIHDHPKGIIIATGVLCGIVVAALVSAYAWRRRQRAKKNGIAPYLAKTDEEGAHSDTPPQILPNAPVLESSDRRIRYFQDQMRIIESEIVKLKRSHPEATNRRSGDADRREGGRPETIDSSTVVGHS